ncbi:hypothetical protein QDD76_002543 [Burkholderia cepacia]|uniref:Methyl-accepting transducer domain-containing protein n=1 Tax=Burkholderia contaminans TaxID=488447 RepID=A0A2S5DP14_9BURK|nr:hypothetical protein [Burkholderia cepacia]OXI54296.1 hypothetical protein CFB47_35025 [Burkholderia sp. AU27893]POZ80824.1 hypothetical protein C3743_34745 [Burkholderia contaminans]EKS9804548.1 hypothetical protein [Burkholderia cepacia]EKS9811098.1 hypothetical protein [Burkholderia cepacia]
MNSAAPLLSLCVSALETWPIFTNVASTLRVRSLAQRSAQAAREVKQLVEEAVSGVEAALVQQAGETMGKIVAYAADVRSVVSGIARSATEQTHGIQEVNRALMQLDEMVQENVALVEELAAASAALQTQADALAPNIGRFTIDRAFFQNHL